VIERHSAPYSRRKKKGEERGSTFHVKYLPIEEILNNILSRKLKSKRYEEDNT
jgi:hypothetical protein